MDYCIAQLNHQVIGAYNQTHGTLGSGSHVLDPVPLLRDAATLKALHRASGSPFVNDDDFISVIFEWSLAAVQGGHVPVAPGNLPRMVEVHALLQELLSVACKVVKALKACDCPPGSHWYQHVSTEIDVCAEGIDNEVWHFYEHLYGEIDEARISNILGGVVYHQPKEVEKKHVQHALGLTSRKRKIYTNFGL
ncbi:hypothetical protein MNV49_004874 [Pseudohyphozyma bogoriensis]|nr:hypothetical protein MNV49_004874 [Pseudohyphozyma bogoriensis]